MNFARIWCIQNPPPARRVTSPWNVYMAKIDPGWEGYPVWTGGLPHLRLTCECVNSTEKVTDWKSCVVVPITPVSPLAWVRYVRVRYNVRYQHAEFAVYLAEVKTSALSTQTWQKIVRKLGSEAHPRSPTWTNLSYSQGAWFPSDVKSWPDFGFIVMHLFKAYAQSTTPDIDRFRRYSWLDKRLKCSCAGVARRLRTKSLF